MEYLIKCSNVILSLISSLNFKNYDLSLNSNDMSAKCIFLRFPTSSKDGNEFLNNFRIASLCAIVINVILFKLSNIKSLIKNIIRKTVTVSMMKFEILLFTYLFFFFLFQLYKSILFNIKFKRLHNINE